MGKRAQPDEATAVSGEKKVRQVYGDKGWLADQVDKVILRWSDEAPGEREALTPHRIAKQITNRDGGTPSTGAVTAVLDRFEKYGYVTLGTDPKQVKRITAKGVKDGRGGCQEAYHDRLIKEKQKARAAEAEARGEVKPERKPRTRKTKDEAVSAA